MAEYSAIYEDAVDRITAVYASCSKAEQKLLRDILEEMSIKGYSQTLEQVWLSDFSSIPVSIDQFLDDPYYLGQTNDLGKNVYPFWRKTMGEIFNAGNKYNEIILSGATRLGKSSSGVTMMAYMLYRLMLYRNPHQYFQKKAISKFTLGFANLTKELAFSVAYREFNDTLKEVPWFMEHGTVTRSDRNFYYLPEGDKIEIVAASDGSQLLGKQLWCLKGNTRILTLDGVKTLSDCEGSIQPVIQYSENGCIVSDAAVIKTKEVTELIRIELEDGSVIEGTSDHKVMLSDGSYKALGELSSSDDLLTFHNIDELNFNYGGKENMTPSAYDSKFVVYIHTSPYGKRYIGITSRNVDERWGSNGNQYSQNAHFWSAICKYGWSNFKHEIVAEDLSVDDACRLEIELIEKYNTMDPDKGYNHTSGGNIYFFDEATKKKMSAHAWCKGKSIDSDDRIRKIADARRGVPISEEHRAKQSRSMKAKYASGYAPRWINNGEVEVQIQDGDVIPEGFSKGRLSTLDKYVYKGTQSKKINHSEIENYLAKGWKLGRPAAVSESIRKSLQTMHWEYNGERFETAKQLANYLNQNGYPNIVDSTITSLYRKGFSKSKTYCSLDGKIKRIDHEDKINQ